MTDEHTDSPGAEAPPTNPPEAPPTSAAEAPLTSEQRLRALTSDRKPKSRGKSAPVPVDAQRRPGDVVDAVRERSNMDPGRDTPF
ncbi:MAG: hypothetical protein MUQ32_09925 [Chloroflexi bacterium]|nr:hypothetical protein [Chloroflexota bacterium]